MIRDDRLLDLLTAAATEGLADSERRELEALLAGQDAWSADDFELAAAEIDVAFQQYHGDSEPLPEHVRHRILRASKRHLPTAAPSPRTFAWAGWIAAAAVLVLALWAPWRTTEGPLDGAELRRRLLGTAPDAVRVEWGPSEFPEYTAVRGDVVWSADLQEGYMRLSGLPRNDPSREQYQLWIVDPSRDERPVDGGVFDVTEDGEVVIPIDAKLAVHDAKAFAITLERPGGVVVSDGPLLVVAAI